MNSLKRVMPAVVAAAALAVALVACGEGGATDAADAAVSEDRAASNGGVADITEEGNWILDRSTSYVAFSGVQTGNRFEGRFTDFDVMINFDPDDLSAAEIRGQVSTASAETGDRQRDEALPGETWFGSGEHPLAVFEARDVRAAGEGAYEARGTLAIRDVVRDVVLPFTLRIDGARAEAKASLTIVRSDYGVGRGSDFEDDKWVGLEAPVEIVIHADRAP